VSTDYAHRSLAQRAKDAARAKERRQAERERYSGEVQRLDDSGEAWVRLHVGCGAPVYSLCGSTRDRLRCERGHVVRDGGWVVARRRRLCESALLAAADVSDVLREEAL
jgi:hypothetical protein